MSKDLKWHSGPPPHVGWWNASRFGCIDAWRWWDGIGWSDAAFPGYTSLQACACAKFRAPNMRERPIKWRHYYPDGARVPRINPEAA